MVILFFTIFGIAQLFSTVAVPSPSNFTIISSPPKASLLYGIPLHTLLQPLAPTNLLFLWACLFWAFHHLRSLCLLLSVNVIFLRFLHVVTCITISPCYDFIIFQYMDILHLVGCPFTC